MTTRTGYRYRDHCWQLQEDLIELRFYLERLYQEVVEEPGQKFIGRIEDHLQTQQGMLEDLNNNMKQLTNLKNETDDEAKKKNLNK